ncbi:MAG: GcrA family cell cycle regulator [Rhodomicrobium sp.]
MSWTNDRVATLKKLWNDGLSASAIAQTIGAVTRNAVIGKVHRLGLSGRATGLRKRAPARASSLFPAPSCARKTRALPRRRRELRRPVRAVPTRPLVLPELGPPPDRPITVQTLTAISCRWPVDDPKAAGFHFCGRSKAAGCPYCAHHAAIAYRPGRRL